MSGNFLSFFHRLESSLMCENNSAIKLCLKYVNWFDGNAPISCDRLPNAWEIDEKSGCKCDDSCLMRITMFKCEDLNASPALHISIKDAESTI